MAMGDMCKPLGRIVRRLFVLIVGFIIGAFLFRTNTDSPFAKATGIALIQHTANSDWRVQCPENCEVLIQISNDLELNDEWVFVGGGGELDVGINIQKSKDGLATVVSGRLLKSNQSYRVESPVALLRHAKLVYSKSKCVIPIDEVEPLAFWTDNTANSVLYAWIRIRRANIPPSKLPLRSESALRAKLMEAQASNEQ
jgi:hypothetical protein